MAPITEELVPAGQLVQAVAPVPAMYVPGRQLWQLASELPPAEARKVPCGHAVQLASEGAPVTAE